MNILNWLSQKRKAIAAFVIAELTILVTYLQFISVGSVTTTDWIILLVAEIGALGTTFGVHQATNTQ